MQPTDSAGNPLMLRERRYSLPDLSFPKDVGLFLILPYSAIKDWLYSLDPKDALILSCDKKFVNMLDKKRNEPILFRAINWLVRRVHGLHF